jgi:hypothetical protein
MNKMHVTNTSIVGRNYFCRTCMLEMIGRHFLLIYFIVDLNEIQINSWFARHGSYLYSVSVMDFSWLSVDRFTSEIVLKFPICK